MKKETARAPRRPVPRTALLTAPLVLTVTGVLEAEAEGMATVLGTIVVGQRVVEFWKETMVLEVEEEEEVVTGAEVEEEEEVVTGAEVEVEVEEMTLDDDERVEEVDVDAKVEIWESWTVLVTLAPRITKGFEYWKVAGLESSCSLRP